MVSRPSSKEIALKIKASALKRTRRCMAAHEESPLKKATSPPKEPKKNDNPRKKDKAADKATSPLKEPKKNGNSRRKDKAVEKATSRVISRSETDGSVGTAGGSSKSIRSAIAREKAAIAKALKEKQAEENATGGLRLLKRGTVTMSSIPMRVARGIKLVVAINLKGKPFGAVASEMQSYIGTLARTKVPISIADWRNEDLDDTKQRIWVAIQVFNLHLTFETAHLLDIS